MNPDTRSLRTASLIAGLGLALIVVLAPFGNFVAVQPLITPGDAAKTVQDILNSESLFRWGIASLVLTAVLDMIVAGALFVVFEPVSRGVSMMARCSESHIRRSSWWASVSWWWRSACSAIHPKQCVPSTRTTQSGSLA